MVWGKSPRQLPWFLEQADQAAISDNSGAVPRLVGRKQDGAIVVDPGAAAALREALNLVGGARA
jgi:predicted ABC-type ATPase